jgi:hypothetical protein
MTHHVVVKMLILLLIIISIKFYITIIELFPVTDILKGSSLLITHVR